MFEMLLTKRDLFYKNLLISSFLEIKTKKEIKISIKEVSDYYNNNKKSFIRKQDEILLKHFILPTKKEANKLKGLLKSNKKGDQLEEYVKKIKKNPRNYIGQKVVSLSTSPTLIDNELSPRHIDLRPFIISGSNQYVTQGGLTRVALKKGSLIVNSSQGGGSKDTWILDN